MKKLLSTPLNKIRHLTGSRLLLIWILGFVFWALQASPAFAANSSIFSASLWVKPDTSVASKAIVGKSEEMRIFTDASGFVGCQIKTTTWQTAAQATTTALALNSWSFVACTYDKINLRVYVNGVQVASTALTTTVDDTASVLRIGQDDSADALYTNFSGITDNFQFYNYARSVSQITQDMLGGHPAVSGGGTGDTTVIASAARQSAPLAWYKFNEGYGTTAHNAGSGGSTLNGTLSGTTTPSWSQSGKFGKALSFNGIGSYVNIPDSPSISLINPLISLNAWVNPTSVVSQAILVKNNEYRLVTNASGFPLCQIYNGSAWQTAATSNVALVAGAWEQVGCTYDGTTLKVTVKGLVRGSQALSAIYNDTTNALRVGTDAEATYNFFSGLIDDVKIYNYALTSDEIKLDYNAGNALKLGSFGNNSSYASDASNQTYCIPGDTTSCAPPVAEWNFEEGSGLYAEDTSGNNLRGTLGVGSSAPTWTTGKIGKAMNFDGSDDYISLPTAAKQTGAHTIELWINPKSWTNETLPTIFGGRGVGGNLTKGGIALTYSTPTNALYYQFYDASLIFSANVSASYVPIGSWSHISLSWDGTSNSDAMKIYVNGILRTTAAATGLVPPLEWGAWSFNLGGAASSDRGNFFGSMDNFKIYNYARTPAQVAWDYNNGKPVAWYKMDECQGSVIHSSNSPYNSALNGTLNLGASPAAGTCTDGTGTSAWNLGASGKYNASLKFDGTDDYISVGTSIPTNSVSFWVKPTTNTASMINLTSGAYITASTGVISATGLSSPTYFVNGQITATPTLTANVWNHIVVTTGTLITANTFTIAKANGAYTAGQLDDVQIYNYALTPSQIKLMYNQNSAIRFGPVTGSP